MLRKPKKISAIKWLLLYTILLITIPDFSTYAIDNSNGDKYSYNGNVVTYTKQGVSDTVQVEDPITKESGFVITTRNPLPVLLNREKIYSWNELTNHVVPSGYTTSKSAVTATGINEYLLTNLDKELRRLPDGEYTLGVYDVVVDKEGAIVFFQFSGIHEMVKKDDGKKHGVDLDKKTTEKFAKKVAILLNNSPKHRPAWYEGKKVVSVVESGYYMPFVVKDGRLESL